MEELQIIIDKGVPFGVFILGALASIEGFAIAVNFMGDQKISIIERLSGLAIMILGIVAMKWAITL